MFVPPSPTTPNPPSTPPTHPHTRPHTPLSQLTEPASLKSFVFQKGVRGDGGSSGGGKESVRGRMGL